MKKIDNIKKIIDDLILNYKQDAQLSIIEFSSKLLAYITTLIIFILIISSSIIFFSFSLALYLNEILDSSFLGFTIIGISLILLLIILKLITDKRKQPLFVNVFIKIFVKLFFNKNKEGHN